MAALAEQLTLDFTVIANKTQVEFLNDRVDMIESETRNVRKGLFARYDALNFLYLEMSRELKELKEKLIATP